MGITTTSVLSAPLQQSFSMKLLSIPVPYLIHKIPAELKTMPRNGGVSLRVRRYNRLATAPVPLANTGITPPPQVLTAVNLDATMSVYGTYVVLNEQVTLQAQDLVLNECIKLLGISLRMTEDQIMKDYLRGSTAQVNATNGVNGDVPTEITRQDVDLVIRTLRGHNAYSFLTGISGEDRFGTGPVRDAYFALGSTDLIGQIDLVTGFKQKWEYPSQSSTLEAEWGCVANLRFLLSSEGSKTLTSSLLGADIYNIFCVGREAYCAIDQDSYNSQFIYRPAIYDSPLALNASCGWKMAEVPLIENDQWCLKLCVTLA